MTRMTRAELLQLRDAIDAELDRAFIDDGAEDWQRRLLIRPSEGAGLAAKKSAN